MNTIWARHALLPEGWAEAVRIDWDATGRITSVEPGAAPSGMRTGLLLPAPANVHSHSFQRAMAGLTEQRGPDPSDTFWTWRRLMYRFLNRLTPDHVQAIAALVQMEMLEAGYAANVEFHYLHHAPDGSPYANPAEMSERIAAAAAQTGIGLTLLPVHYQFGGCDQRPLGAGQIRFGTDDGEFAALVEAAKTALSRLGPDVVLGVAPHSLRAVAPETLARLPTLIPDGPVHMHLAEQTAEVEEVHTAWGTRPVEWVLDHLGPDQRWCLIHCTQMTPQETVGLARTGAVAGLCPITEANLGDGIFDAQRWHEAGGHIAIGSDSNVQITLTGELRLLEYSQRLRDRARVVLTSPGNSCGRTLYEAVCSGGAQAAGRHAGQIAEGRWADLVSLDAAHVAFEGRHGDRLLDSFIFAGNDRMVTDVWSAGRHMVKQGRHINRDRIEASYRQAISGLETEL